MNSILIEEMINSKKDDSLLYYTIELETLNIELDFKSSS